LANWRSKYHYNKKYTTNIIQEYYTEMINLRKILLSDSLEKKKRIVNLNRTRWPGESHLKFLLGKNRAPLKQIWQTWITEGRAFSSPMFRAQRAETYVLRLALLRQESELRNKSIVKETVSWRSVSSVRANDEKHFFSSVFRKQKNSARIFVSRNGVRDPTGNRRATMWMSNESCRSFFPEEIKHNQPHCTTLLPSLSPPTGRLQYRTAPLYSTTLHFVPLWSQLLTASYITYLCVTHLRAQAFARYHWTVDRRTTNFES